MKNLSTKERILVSAIKMFSKKRLLGRIHIRNCKRGRLCRRNDFQILSKENRPPKACGREFYN